MGLLKVLKVEIVSVIFGLIGLSVVFFTNNPDVGVALCSTSITSYFAFKKSEVD